MGVLQSSQIAEMRRWACHLFHGFSEANAGESSDIEIKVFL